MQRQTRRWRGRLAALALGAALLGGCAGATPERQAKSATKIADVITSRPGAPQGIALEASFEEEEFKTHYRVWFRLPDLAREDKPSQDLHVTSKGANCGTWGGEPSLFGNSRPSELKRDDAHRVDLTLTGRSPDGKDGSWVDFVWFHPHPPCGNTPDHRDATISITVRNPSGAFTCTYVGSATGTGACKPDK
jgi:hypothetical protein